MKQVLNVGRWLLGWCFPLTVMAQPQLPPVTTFTPQDYGMEQPPENYAICTDDRGFIYSGNSGGVFEYDGHTWNFIPVVTGSLINAVSPAPDHAIAVGGLNFFGLLKPDEKGRYVYHSLQHLLPDTLGSFAVVTIHSVGGRVFFQTEKAVYVYEKGKIKTHLPEVSFFRGVACDGRYFVRSRTVGLLEFKDGQFSLFASDTISRDYGFFGLVSYDKDHFLAATNDAGFYLLHKKTGQIESFLSFFFEDYFPKIYDLKKLPNNLYAIATINHGVVVLDQELEIKARSGRNEGLKTNNAKAVCVDKMGNVWAATESGVSLIDIHSPLHFYTEFSGLHGNVQSIQHIGTNYYAGTTSGVYYLPESGSGDSKPWQKISDVNTLVNGMDANERDILIASMGGLYAGTLTTFYLLDEGNYTSVKFIPGINKIIGVMPDKIRVVDNVSYQIEKEIPLPVPIQISLSISFDTSFAGRTRIWIGTHNQGVLRLDILKDGSTQLDHFSEADGLPKGDVHPFNFIGKPVFLTSAGLQHFIAEEEVMKSLSEEEKNDPAFNRGYFDVFEIPGIDIKGNLTGMVLDNGRIYFCADNKICYYDEKGKKYTREFSTLKMGRINELKAIKGNLWILTAEGAAQFNPFHLKNIDHKYRLYFRNITASGDHVLMSGFFVQDGKIEVNQPADMIPELIYKGNSLVFELASDYYDWNNKLEYTYYLEGVDETWGPWSKDNRIRFTNLHEGEYVLHVKARNVYGVESSEAVYRFIILPPWYRTWWAYVLYVLLAVLIIFLSIRIASYRLKQSNIRLEKTVQERTMEIALKNVELKSQNEQILHQKQEITDSINYARRIQEAILPVKKEIQKVFPESFVLFKPKDIVSGDFYWFAHHDQLSIFICADCTGHGVPGAFMSMICTDRLNHTVLEKKIITPSGMLREVNQGIKRSLKQDDESNLKTKDGMDAAVCSYDHQRRILKYAGANRPLWLLRNGEIMEYKPTKTAVGGFTPEDQHFEEQEIQIEKEDVVYLSTDGYADQFGGPKGKKLMVKAFKEILIQYSTSGFEEQRRLLDEHIENWRNHQAAHQPVIEQVDDMCVMGIRFT